MRKKEFNTEEIKEIINDYTIIQNSMTEIGKKFGVSKTVISRVLKENNISANKKQNHKYYADYDKFHDIDSSEKAYWLGFIAADGCNYEREKNASIVINIHQQDIDHLKKFKDFMNTNAEIHTFIQNAGFSNNTPMCKITLNSKEMSHDLSDKGVVPRKSLILEPPKIDEKYFLPFILGYFDGDGSVYQLQNKEFGISIVGTKEILLWINNILNITNQLEQRIPTDKNTYHIRCGGIDKPYFILKSLYDSCKTHLERKYQKYKTLETVVLNRNIK